MTERLEPSEGAAARALRRFGLIAAYVWFAYGLLAIILDNLDSTLVAFAIGNGWLMADYVVQQFRTDRKDD